MKQDINRATGRTTGLMIQALGKAVENPGTEVEFIDHQKQNFAQLQYCKERIEKIAKKLNLDVSVKNFHYAYRPEEEDKLLVKSNWISPYSQSRVAEEKWKEIYGCCPNKQYTSWHYFLQGFEVAQKYYGGTGRMSIIKFNVREDFGTDYYVQVLNIRKWSLLQVSVSYNDYAATPYLQITFGSNGFFSILSWVYRFGLDVDILSRTWNFDYMKDND